jgi:transcriptional regulator with XRE-family HTH domain
MGAEDQQMIEPGVVRDGTSELELRALARLRQVLASVPVALLVRLVLWPERVAELAEREGIASVQIYNTLSGKRPYRAVRQRLARRFGLSIEQLGIIDRARMPLAGPAALPEAARASVRDGESALEQLAYERACANIGAFPPGLVFQLMLWPQTEAELAAELGYEPQDFYNMLTCARGYRYDPIRERLCEYLELEPHWLEQLIERPRAEPVPLEVAAA